jgi:hypothetical protein
MLRRAFLSRRQARFVADAIDITMLRIDIWGDAASDAAEHDRLRAHRVVEHICHRFPTVRYYDAPQGFLPSGRPPCTPHAGKRKGV